MFPILINLPFFQLKSLTVLSLLALFFAAFIFWRKGREEYYSTFEIFDVFLLSGLFGFIFGRLAFVLFHLPQFSSNIWSVFNIVERSGNEPLLALAAAAWYLHRHAVRNKWDAFEILDFYVTSLSLGMVFVYLGFFLDGSYSGVFTSLPWGVVLNNTFEKVHPVQIYFAIFYLALFVYLNRMEYVYRTLQWYRKGKKTAQSGFLFSNFLIFTGLFYVLTGPFRLPSMMVGSFNVDYLAYLLIAVLGGVILFVRSGRGFRK